MKHYPAVEIAKYFVQKYFSLGQEPSKLKVQKLLYYAQAFRLSLSNGDEYLFDEDIEPWKYGPVVSSVYKEWDFIIQTEETVNIDEETKSLLDNVWDYFASEEPYEMINRTHKEDPWLNAYKQSDRIPLSSIYNYFKGRVFINKGV